MHPDTRHTSKSILHIASIAAVNDLYEHFFHTIAGYGINQKVFVPCNSADKGAYRLKQQPAGGGLQLATAVVANPLARLLFFPKAAMNFSRLEGSFAVDELDFTFAHTLLTDGILAYKLFRKHKVPYTVTVQSTDVNVFLKKLPFLRPMAKKIIGSAAKIIFLNGAYKEKLLRYFRKDGAIWKRINEISVLLPYGVDEYWIRNAASTPKEPANNKRVKCLFVGRLLKLKNIENVIKSILKLNSEGYSASITIVGGRYDAYEMVNRYAAQYPDIVKYLGSIYDKDELKRLYREHDIFVMPSFIESFGLVYIEAMSQGTPVIYSEHEGIYGIFEEGTVGYGPSPYSVDEIAEAVRNIMANYASISRNCIAKAADFSWNVITSQYLDIWESVVKQNMQL